MERVVGDAAGVLIRQHGDEAVARVGREVVDHAEEPAAVRTRRQAPHAGDAEVRKLLAAIGRGRIDRAGGIDRGELDRLHGPIADSVAPAGRLLDEGAGLLPKRCAVGSALPGRLGGASEHRVEVAGERRQVQPPGEGGVGGVELPGGRRAGVEPGEDRLPSPRDLVERHVDAEDALGIERREELDGLRAIVARGDASCADLVELCGESLVLLVRRERDAAAIDQLLVDLPPLDEVARVGVELAIAEHDRHADLVAARELDVNAARILRAWREPGVEGRLVPMEVDAGCRLARVPFGLGRLERRAGDGRRESERHQGGRKSLGDSHFMTSPSESCCAPLVAFLTSSGASAGMFFSSSLPRNGRHWKSQSFAPLKPNSMSQGRGRPAGSFTGVSCAVMVCPTATSCFTSSGSRTYSFPLDGTMVLPPVGRSRFFQGDLNMVTSSVRSGAQSSVSADVPSTAPLGPSDVATVISFWSPELTSAVTSTPDLSFATDSRMTTDDSTQIGSSISVCRQENERNSNGDAQTSRRPE